MFVLVAGDASYLKGTDDGFLSCLSEQIFRKDALELVHEEDPPARRPLISEVIKNPGTSLSAELRFREASSGWRLMNTCAQNILEAPDNAGLVVVNVRDAALCDGDGR